MEESYKSFDEEIIEKLGKISTDQKIDFAWLCAVRALPFLSKGKKRNFEHWQKKERQKLLLSVFRAVDIANFESMAIVPTIDFITYNNGNNKRDPRITFYHDKFSIDINCAKANVVITVSSFFYNANTSAYASSFVIKDSQRFRELLLSDIDKIHENKLDELNNDISIYGEVWQNFQEDLEAVGCGYWAKLYADLFANRFVVDQKELRRRLNVPAGIREQGAKAVADYLTNVQDQGEEIVAKETRLILIGSAGAGKTTLAWRLNGKKKYPKPGDTTHGVDMSIKLNLNGVKTHLWDFGGQVIYHSSHRCFMSEDCVYILVVNGRDEAARDITKIEYWLDTIRVYSNNNAKIFIIVNESDNREQNIDKDYYMQGQYGNLIEDIYHFNIGKNLEKIKEFKNHIARYIESRGFQVIGAKDKKVIDELKTLFDDGNKKIAKLKNMLNGNKKIIKKSELESILEKHDIVSDDDKQRAINLLNILGVALSYDCISDYVLDPWWISHGVYKIVDYMREHKLSLIYRGEFEDVFSNERSIYPESSLDHIFNLMAEHKIGFQNRHGNDYGLKGLLVPCVASQTKPSSVKTKPPIDNTLVIKVTREELKEFPADFFERYIYENQEDIESEGT